MRCDFRRGDPGPGFEWTFSHRCSPSAALRSSVQRGRRTPPCSVVQLYLHILAHKPAQKAIPCCSWQNSFTSKLKVSWKDFYISLTFYNNYTSKILLTRPAPFLPRYQGKTQHFRPVGASAERDATPPLRPRPREAGGMVLGNLKRNARALLFPGIFPTAE